jgi:hypothetical protein
VNVKLLWGSSIQCLCLMRQKQSRHYSVTGTHATLSQPLKNAVEAVIAQLSSFEVAMMMQPRAQGSLSQW